MSQSVENKQVAENEKAKKPKFDFSEAAQKFQKKASKQLKILDFDFKTAFFHPQMEDVIVIYKALKYPADCDIIEYKFQFQDKDQEEHQLLESNRQMNTFKRYEMDMGCVFDFDYQKEAEIANKRIETGADLDGKKSPLNTSPQQEKVQKRGRKNIKDLSFNYESVPFYQVEAGERNEYKKYNYAITFWKTNNAQNPIPFKEYGMHWKPMLDKIFVSLCGQYIYYILGANTEEENVPAKMVVVLDINTLKEVAKYELPDFEDFSDYSILYTVNIFKYLETSIYDTMLCWGGTTLYLSLYSDEDEEYKNLFINLQQQKIEWYFSNNFTEEKGDETLKWSLASQIIIGEKMRNQVFIVGSEDSEECEFHMFRIPYKQDLSGNFSWKKYSIWKKNTEEQFDGADSVYLWYNRSLSQLALSDTDSLAVMTFKAEGFEGGFTFISYLEITEDSRDFQQNAFLSQSILFGFQQGTVTSIYDIDRKCYCQQNRLETNYDGCINDYKIVNKDYVMTIGLRNNKGHIFEEEQSAIQRIYLKVMPIGRLKDKNSEEQQQQQDLQVFVDFLEFNFYNALNHSLKDFVENESLFYLTQRNGICSVNIITFSSFIDSIGYQNFNYYQIKQTINLSKQSITELLKMSLLIVKKDESGGTVDYILVYQNKTTLELTSLMYGPKEKIENICKNIPFIHKMEVNSYSMSDQIFLLVNNGSAVGIQRIFYSGKEGKNTIYDCYSIKTMNPRLFRFYNSRFYVLLDNFDLVRLDLDQGTQKMENQKIFLFSETDIEDSLKLQQIGFDKDAMMVISDSSFYWNVFCFNLNDSTKIKKDKDFFTYKEYIPCNKALLQGPERIKNPDFILYVIKDLNFEYDDNNPGDSDFDEDGEEEKQIKQRELEEEKKDLDIESAKKSKAGFEDATTKVGETNNIIDQKQDYNPSKSYSDMDKKLGLQFNDQKRALFQGDVDSISSSLTLLLTIPADQNYMQFVHNDAILEGKQIYEQNIVSFSSFIQDRSRVLIMIQGIFLVFNKFGSFCCYVDIYNEKLIKQDYLFLKQQSMEEIIQVSDNGQYYLLFNRIMKTYNVFEFKKTGKNSYSMILIKPGLKLPFAKLNQNSNFNSFIVDNTGTIKYLKVSESRSSNNKELNQSMIIDELKSVQDSVNNELVPLNDLKSPCFTLFQDDTDVTSYYQECFSQFELLKQYLNEKPSFDFNSNDEFGAVIIGEYLIIKYYSEIEYMKIFTENHQQRDSKPTMVNLIVENTSEVKMIYSTGSPSLVEFIIRNEPESLIHVLVWDLEQNVEYSQVQLDIEYDETFPEYRIVKGMNPKYNYYCSQNFFCDFQFYFPLKFLKSYQKDNDIKYKEINVNQKNVSYDCSEFLDLSSKNTITYSMNLQSLFYFQQLVDLDKNERDRSKIILSHFKVRINTNTIFHIANMNIFIDDLKLLEMLLEEVYNAEDDEEDVNSNRESLLNILYPNRKGRSAFDLCMKRRSQKIIEVYLYMLIELDYVKHYRFSKFIRKHFDVLLGMGVKVFYKYLEKVTFRLQDMQKPKKLVWPYEEEEIYLQSHTSYLGQDFLDSLQKKQFDKKSYLEGGIKMKKMKRIGEEIKEEEKQVEEEKLDIMNIYDQYSLEEKETSEQKKVDLLGVEFEWIFSGPLAAQFIEQLAEFDDDSIFDIEPIKIIVLYQWGKFFPIIFTKLFLPFIIYFIMYNLYVTLIYQMYTLYPNDLWRLDLAFGIVNIGFVVGFAAIEFRQLVADPLDYIQSFWNWIDILAVVLNSSFIIGDFAGLDPQKQRMIGAASVIVLWLKFYYFLRMFKSTAIFIQMMTQIFADIQAFGFFLTLAFLTFTNTYYVMAFQGYDPDQGPSSLFSGRDFIQSIPYAYLAGLGSSDYSAFDGIKYGQYLFVIWFFEIIIIQLMLLNLLIALLTSSFQGVKAQGDKPYLRGICCLMQDNEIFVNRKKEFGNTKYIIIARLKKGEKDEDKVEDTIWELKQQFKSQIQKYLLVSQEETKQMNTDLNQELMEEIKQCKCKFFLIQNTIQKKQKMLQLK